MPDGSPAPGRPSHGQIFYEFDPNQMGAIKAKWEWDDQLEQWFLITPDPFDSFEYISLPPLEIVEIICECGSESIGSNKHSGWCKKYRPGQ